MRFFGRAKADDVRQLWPGPRTFTVSLVEGSNVASANPQRRNSASASTAASSSSGWRVSGTLKVLSRSGGTAVMVNPGGRSGILGTVSTKVGTSCSSVPRQVQRCNRKCSRKSHPTNPQHHEGHQADAQQRPGGRLRDRRADQRVRGIRKRISRSIKEYDRVEAYAGEPIKG